MNNITKEELKADLKEDLKIDRRVTRAESDIDHTDESVKVVNSDLQNHKVQYRTEFLIMFGVLLGLIVGLFYFAHQINVGMQSQLTEIRIEMADNKQLIVANSTQVASLRLEVRGDNAENRQLIMANSTQLEANSTQLEANSTQLEANSTQLEILRAEAVETNKRLDNVDGRLASVEYVLNINHQPSANNKTDNR